MTATAAMEQAAHLPQAHARLNLFHDVLAAAAPHGLGLGPVLGSSAVLISRLIGE